jgi:hypothetical protein
MSAIQAQHEPSYKELPSFHKVSDQLYLGAQPLEGGFRKLSELGIETVINTLTILRMEAVFPGRAP